MMDVRFGRSTIRHFESFHYYFALPTNMMNHNNFQQVHYHRDEWIVMMEDLFKSFHSNSFNLEDLIIHLFNISSILRITNELQKKLYEPLPIVPIRIDCNCGRFFNSNSPPKSLKLN